MVMSGRLDDRTRHDREPTGALGLGRTAPVNAIFDASVAPVSIAPVDEEWVAPLTSGVRYLVEVFRRNGSQQIIEVFDPQQKL